MFIRVLKFVLLNEIFQFQATSQVCIILYKHKNISVKSDKLRQKQV